MYLSSEKRNNKQMKSHDAAKKLSCRDDVPKWLTLRDFSRGFRLNLSRVSPAF